MGLWKRRGGRRGWVQPPPCRSLVRVVLRLHRVLEALAEGEGGHHRRCARETAEASAHAGMYDTVGPVPVRGGQRRVPIVTGALRVGRGGDAAIRAVPRGCRSSGAQAAQAARAVVAAAAVRRRRGVERAPASCIFSPVCGLRPSRAARSLESKVPKPTSETRSPLATDSTMTSSADPSTAAAVFFETPAFSLPRLPGSRAEDAG